MPRTARLVLFRFVGLLAGAVVLAGSLLVRAAAVTRRLSVVRSFRTAKFVTSAPSAETALGAVPDAWASRLPAPLQAVPAGSAELFDDPRMTWGFDNLGGVEGRTVLELGPLEGGHSYMAQRAGASRVTAVEANKKAFLKCLVVKELLDLDRCKFLCGDVLEHMAADAEDYDLCVACGILYHMTEPVRMIDLISQRASRLLMWTHVYDPAALANEHLAKRLEPATEQEYKGFRYRVHRHEYRFDGSFSGFCGGTKAYSNWMPREELIRTLEHFGWSDIKIGFDEPTHQNGPALALTAVRT